MKKKNLMRSLALCLCLCLCFAACSGTGGSSSTARPASSSGGGAEPAVQGNSITFPLAEAKEFSLMVSCSYTGDPNDLVINQRIAEDTNVNIQLGWISVPVPEALGKAEAAFKLRRLRRRYLLQCFHHRSGRLHLRRCRRTDPLGGLHHRGIDPESVDAEAEKPGVFCSRNASGLATSMRCPAFLSIVPIIWKAPFGSIRNGWKL